MGGGLGLGRLWRTAMAELGSIEEAIGRGVRAASDLSWSLRVSLEWNWSGGTMAERESRARLIIGEIAGFRRALEALEAELKGQFP